MFLDPATTTQVLEVATGFFFIMWLIAATRKSKPGKPIERKRYITEIPSKLVIETEA